MRNLHYLTKKQNTTRLHTNMTILTIPKHADFCHQMWKQSDDSDPQKWLYWLLPNVCRTLAQSLLFGCPTETGKSFLHQDLHMHSILLKWSVSLCLADVFHISMDLNAQFWGGKPDTQKNLLAHSHQTSEVHEKQKNAGKSQVLLIFKFVNDYTSS